MTYGSCSTRGADTTQNGRLVEPIRTATRPLVAFQRSVAIVARVVPAAACELMAITSSGDRQ